MRELNLVEIEVVGGGDLGNVLADLGGILLPILGTVDNVTSFFGQVLANTGNNVAAAVSFIVGTLTNSLTPA